MVWYLFLGGFVILLIWRAALRAKVMRETDGGGGGGAAWQDTGDGDGGGDGGGD